MQKQKKLVAVTAVGAALVFGVATAAVAEEFHDPLFIVQVGVNGSDADRLALVAISQGGCAKGHQVAVAIDTGGNSGGACPNGSAEGSRLGVSKGGCAGGNVAIAVGQSGNCSTGAAGGFVNVGLLGAKSGSIGSEIAISDTGNAEACTWWVVLGSSCWLPPTAVSGTGSASGQTAVSGTGNATSPSWYGTAAVSGTGTASGSNCNSEYIGASVAVSVTGDASGCRAVSGTGHASGTTAVGGGDLLP